MMQRFMMLLDETATPMMETMLVDGMSLQFPSCCFEAQRSCSEDLENSIIPIMQSRPAGTPDGAFYVTHPDPKLRARVTEAFVDLLQGARAALPS